MNSMPGPELERAVADLAISQEELITVGLKDILSADEAQRDLRKRLDERDERLASGEVDGPRRGLTSDR